MTEYDHIVVGAGSAGAVVAARLAEDGRRVLLLEAGGSDDNELIHTPLLFSGLFQGELDWNYNSEAEPGLHGRRVYLPRGKVLGGSSSLNAMFYMRGTHEDFDEWSSDHGATGWSYDEVLPYFRRSENNKDIRDQYHGTNGPLHVTTKRWFSGLADSYIEAALGMGIEANADFNGAKQEGVGLLQLNTHNGRRWSTADAFIRPALERESFALLTGATVRRVIVDGGRATGVEYEREGRIEIAHASGDIVLSAGAYNTPQLLMLSGLGPAAHLREHGIDVVADLPHVGQNLQDHPFTLTHYATESDTTLLTAGHPGVAEQYAADGTGVLSSAAGEAAVMWKSDPSLASPDFQMIFVPGWFWDHGFRGPSDAGVSIGLSYNGPSSRGSVRLRSADPDSAPRIVSNLLGSQGEVDAVLRAIDFVTELTSQAPLGNVITERLNPGPTVGKDLMENWVRAETQHMYHAAGTARIGTSETGVVDPELRVHGIQGLRIADASVMPQITSGNTNAPSIMIGEKAADLVKGITSAHEVGDVAQCPYLAAAQG